MQDKLDPFRQANRALLKSRNRRWQRQQCQHQILRSQVGFGPRVVVNSWSPCQNCANYHGKAYGMSTGSRTVLICGIHPYGWNQNSVCPDWNPLPFQEGSIEQWG